LLRGFAVRFGSNRFLEANFVFLLFLLFLFAIFYIQISIFK